jgi:hypothetical protein
MIQPVESLARRERRHPSKQLSLAWIFDFFR